MNLSATVAFIQQTTSAPRNIYSVSHPTSSSCEKASGNDFFRKTSFGNLTKKKFIKSKSASNSRSSSVVAPPDPSYLYEISSRNCPCNHHRLARLREDAEKSSDFSSSQGTDSGVNSSSNGSQRSSGRRDGHHHLKRTFSNSSQISSSSESFSDEADRVITTTVILEHGCAQQQSIWHTESSKSVAIPKSKFIQASISSSRYLYEKGHKSLKLRGNLKMPAS